MILHTVRDVSMPKSVCAVEMIMHVYLTCTNINRKDVHA